MAARLFDYRRGYLRVDLSTGGGSRVPFREAVLRRYIGGVRLADVPLAGSEFSFRL